MYVLIENEIRIHDIKKELFKEIVLDLTFPNPSYANALKLGYWTGNISPNLSIFRREGDELVIPFGCLRKYVFAKQKEYDYISNKIHTQEVQINYKNSVDLFDYQKAAVEKAMQRKNGIIVAGCGSGKTITGLTIASEVKGKTLWLTHKKDLLNQAMKTAKNIYGLKDEDYGKITDGKVEVGKVITFATVQTMVKTKLSDFKDMFDCIITDECHHLVGTPSAMTMFSTVINSLSARYKIGLTATPNRSDGLERSMFSILGETIYEVKQEDLKERIVPIEVFYTNTNFTPNLDNVTKADGVLNYTNLINELCQNEERNDIIANLVNKLEGSTLILSERVAQCTILKNKIENSIQISSRIKAEDREKILEKLNNDEIKVVLATYSLAKEGLDVPNLKNLVFASPVKEHITVKQSIGRVRRIGKGKLKGNVYDFVDDFPYLYGMLAKRKRIYKYEGEI